jgi:drug/metabolite transporter (DMT)-like permease
LKKIQPWLVYSILTLVFWGIWGALIEIPEKAGFPATLGFVIWSSTMVLPCIYALWSIDWKIDTKLNQVRDGMIIGLTGAGGQLLLFKALVSGPAYIVFPFVSLYPVLTILLSMYILKEKATKKQWIGIIVALIAIYLFSYKDSGSVATAYGAWLPLSIGVFILWGIQALFFKFANTHSKAESIFFYMTLSGLIVAPFAFFMTDFSVDINYGFKGPYLAFMIQLLNSVGALLIVFAFRYGKAIIVAPLTGLAPMITVFISLLIYSIWPTGIMMTAILCSLVSIYLLAE